VLIGMHLATTRGDIHRAFLEAIAFGFRRHVEIFEEDGLKVATTYVTNGGSTSRFWREVLADVLHRELTSLVAHPGASFGAAVCAGVGVGAIDDWTFVRGALDVAEVITPNESHAERYDQRYREFIGLTDATAPFTRLIARST
ncbi:MAG: FGGY-family carbohydrate kinase, partial [Minisyncoccia bacterium]